MTALHALLTLVAIATPAFAAPKIEPVLTAGGIALPDEARAGTFCAQSRRAVAWLASGDAIAIDRKGVVTPLGALGRPTGSVNRIVCDRQDRVVAIDRDQLVILEAGRTRTVQHATALSQLGLLGDGRVGVLDRDGKVSSWNGRTLTPSWQTSVTLPTFNGVQWAPDGSALAFIDRGAVNVVDASGLRIGPLGSGVVWEGETLVVATAKRGLARWRPTDRPDELDVIDGKAIGANLFWAGTQLVQQAGRKATVRTLGAPPLPPVELTRWPLAATPVLAGDASFLVIVGGKTAYVVDLARDTAVVPELHPHGSVTDMVFSPDGTQLAVTAGDAVLVAKLGARAVERREYPATIFEPRLFWDAKGLLAVFLTQRVRWTGGRREVQPLADRGASYDEHGDSVDMSSLCKQAYASRVWRGYAATRCRGKIVFGAIGKPILHTAPQTASAFAIAGSDPQLIYADNQKVMAVGRDGTTRELGTVTGFVSSLVPTADGKRLAIVHGDSISVWDLDRGRVMTAVNPAGRLARVAWSPDGRLAVANGMAVAVWRF